MKKNNHKWLVMLPDMYAFPRKWLSKVLAGKRKYLFSLAETLTEIVVRLMNSKPWVVEADGPRHSAGKV